MYLLSLLFQGIISILLVVFIITTLIGVYSYFNRNHEPSRGSSNLDKNADEQVSEDRQNNKDVVYNEQSIEDKQTNKDTLYRKNERIFVNETNFMDINCTETSGKVEEPSKTDIIDLDEIIKTEAQNSSESQANSEDKEETYVSKPSTKRFKKKRSQH